VNSKKQINREQIKSSGKRFDTLGWRILFWMSLVALGPLLIMAYQGYHCARQALVESQEAHLLSVLESRKTRLEAWLSEIKADFRFLAATPCAHGSCGGCISPTGHIFTQEGCNLLDSMKQRNACYDVICVFDPNWKPLFHTTGEAVHPGSIFSQAFRSLLAKSEGFTTFTPPPSEQGEICLLAGQSIVGADGGRAGYIATCLNLSQSIEPILQDRSGLGKTGKIYLLSRNGQYVAAPSGDPDLLGEKHYLSAEFRSGKESMPDGASKVQEYENARGIMVLGAAAFLPALNWIIVGEINQSEAFAWLHVLRKRALITGAATLIIVLVLSVIRSRKLSQPLREMAAVSRKIAKGYHEERLSNLSGSEAREVSRAFNKMLDQLAASHRRLQHAASLAAVGELSSSIVHEIRNPLSSIKLNLQALHRKVQDDAAHAELADIAMTQVARLEKMLTDLLSYGKPLHLHLGRVTVGDLARDAVEVVRKEREEKQVSVDIEDHLGQTGLIADGEQIRRALTNLVVNAVQAVPESGIVLISAKIDPGDLDRMIISVSDNGPGIPELHRDQLFQPFFTTRDGGTGLGLANVRKIVEDHGGTVSAANRPGGGAVFTMVLPLGGPPV